MQYFLTRRTYNAQKQKFTNNPASVTRYVAMGASSGEASKGHVLPVDKWAAKVLAEEGSKQVLIFVHGFNTDQHEMLTRLTKISKGAKDAGFDGRVVAFDWPSAGKTSLGAYRTDRTNAKAVARYMVLDGIKTLKKANPSVKIHLLAHSMGALLSLRGMSEVGNSLAPGGSGAYLDKAAFVAGDVEQDWMEPGAWGGMVTSMRAKAFTNYYSKGDLVLDVSGQFVNWPSQRAGQHGIDAKLPARDADVSCEARYKTFIPKKRDRNTRNSHTWYFDDKLFYKDLVAMLQGKSLAPTRFKLPDGDFQLKP